ncbi:MAG: DUF3553 domain-containing protein [Acetobacteraceae bacterium]
MGVVTEDEFQTFLEPGMLVRRPTRPEWGIGQVQSAIAWRVTVTFPEQGKQMIDARHVTLIVLPEGD